MLNILILLSTLFCQTSPVTLSSKSTLVDYSGERYFQLMFTVKSLSKEAFKYSSKVSYPKDLELIEGDSSYDGSFKGLGEKTYSVIINPLKEGSGSIKLDFNFYNGEETSTPSSRKTFLTSYSVVKGTDAKLVFTTKDLAQTNKDIKSSEEESVTVTEEDEATKANTSGDQGFRVAKRSHSLEMFRYFLFLVSLSILGFFIYRVRKK